MSETNEILEWDEVEFTLDQYRFEYDEFILDSEQFVGDSRAGSFTFGPLTVEWKYIPSNAIEVKVKLVGVTIWSGTFQVGKKTGVSINVDAGLAKCDIALNADFTKKELTVKGKACVREIVKWPPSLGWSCSSIPKDPGKDHKVIFRW